MRKYSHNCFQNKSPIAHLGDKQNKLMTEGFGNAGENMLRPILNDINIGIVLTCVSSLH